MYYSTRKKTESQQLQMVLLLHDVFIIMFHLRTKKQCCSLLLPGYLVFEIRHDFVRIESTVLNLRFSEKKAVWMLIFVCPRYLGIYWKRRKGSFC